MTRHRVGSLLARAILALLLTIGSIAIVQRDHKEVAIYGTEGELHENVRPRPVGGWPAPFLADSTATSVPFQLGIEDDVRFGPFVANLAFWFLLISVAFRLLRRR